MIRTLVILQLAAATASAPGQIDSICRAKCEVLAVRAGEVRLINQWLSPATNIDLGKYAGGSQSLVPRAEAPVLDVRSRGGWRVVASVYFDHDQDDVLTHVRFFAPGGELRATSDALMLIEQAKIGNLFGGPEEIFAITSNEEHSYNTQTEVWLLPASGDPKLLLAISGDFGRFSSQVPGGVAGMTVARQTYDGEHAETKGTVEEFYVWDSKSKLLTLQRR
jgi:hypothetical protein